MKSTPMHLFARPWRTPQTDEAMKSFRLIRAKVLPTEAAKTLGREPQNFETHLVYEKTKLNQNDPTRRQSCVALERTMYSGARRFQR
jgi:hypothetical protein